MEQRHKEFFEKLRALCEEYGAILGVTNGRISFDFQIIRGERDYLMNETYFSGATNTEKDIDTYL